MRRISRRVFGGGALAAMLGCSSRPRARPAGAPVGTARADEAAAAAPARAALRILDAYPALRDRLPHVALGAFPTPVERAVDLGRALGLGSLWLKRDDVSGEVYGGGKTRKLEMFFGEAARTGAGTVVTSGGAGSNHAVATALYARQLGIGARLLLLPEPSSDHVRARLLAAHRAGAELHLSSAPPRVEPGVYVIPRGGSSPLGNVAFASAAFELRDQIEAGLLPEPHVVYIAMGTMGSAVGLAVGLAAAGLRTRVVAVRASSPGTSSAAGLRAMHAGTVAFLRGLDASFPALDLDDDRLAIDGRQLGAGYARPTRAGAAATELAGRHAGLSLEPTYTAKAMAALAAAAPELGDRVVLFWSTHSARELVTAGVDPRGLPAELRAYFPGAR